MATPGAGLVERARARLEPLPPPLAALPDPGPLATPYPLRAAAPRPEEIVLRRVAPPAPAAQEVREPAPADAAWPARDELRGPYLRVAQTFLVRELPEGLEIVDQHALHERVTFEGLKAELAQGGVAIQRLLVPELVEVSPAELADLAAQAPALERIGILLEAFGVSTVAVHGVPALLASGATERLVRDLLVALARLPRLPSAAELLEALLHSRACRSSVMAGDELSDEEIRALLRRAAELPEGQTCPHGRPTRVRFTRADLERAFERR
jgi:DNA mismatch repair protein MutL